MKKVLLTLVALMTVSIPTAMAAEVSGDIYAGVYDKYMWRGFDLSGNKAVAQGGMDISVDSFTFSYWTNMQMVDNDRDGYNAGEANETDIVIDYSTDLSDMVSLSVGNIFYGLEGLKDTNELYVSVSLATILDPSFTLYYDYDEAEETGIFFTAAVGHGLDLSDAAALSFGALISYNFSSDYAVGDYDDLHNAELSAGLDYTISDTLSASASILFSTPLSDDAEDIAGIDDELSGGVSLTYAF